MAVTASLLSACGGGSTALPGKSTAAGDDSIEKILADAPVASSAEITGAMKKIRDRGVLVVGGRETATLFSLKDPVTGKMSGFDWAMSQVLSKYILGEAKTKLVIVDANTRELRLQNHEVDTVFATYTITPARAEKIAFSEPIFESGQGIAVRKSNKDIHEVTDLAGQKVTAQTGSTSITAITKYAPAAKQTLFAQPDECLQSLKNGRVDAYVNDYANLVGAATRNPDIKVLEKPFTVDPLGIGMAKDQPELKTFVNAWLKLIIEKGIWARVWKQSLGTVISGDAPQPPKPGSAVGS
jgi:glutamate transport system substrate-binding protein